MKTKSTKKARRFKHGQGFRRQALRNAAPASALPRAKTETRSLSSALDGKDSRAWQAAKLGAGMLAGTLACAYIAKHDWLPPKTITGLTTAGGAALLLGAESPTWRLVGAGAAATAGGQLLLLAVDEQIQSKPPKHPEQVASKDTPPAKKPSNADGLPPGALERAYERARRRLEMTQAGDIAHSDAA